MQIKRRIVVKTGDQTFSVATLADVTSMSFEVRAGRYYRFNFVVVFQSDTAGIGVGLGLTFPTVTIFAGSARAMSAADGGGAETQGPLTTSGDKFAGLNIETINTDYLAFVDGVIIPSADGTLQLQASTESGTTNIVVRQGTMGEIEERSP